MGLKDRIYDAISNLGKIGTAVVVIGLVLGTLLILPVSTLWAINHLNTAFGLGLNEVNIFGIKNILAVAIAYAVLAGIFGSSD